MKQTIQNILMHLLGLGNQEKNLESQHSPVEGIGRVHKQASFFFKALILFMLLPGQSYAESIAAIEDPCYYISIYGYSGNGICDTTRAASINRYVSIQVGANGEWQACTYNTKLDLSNGNDAAKCITPLTDIDVKGNVSVWTRKAGSAWNINSVPSSYDPKYSCPPNQNWTYSSSYKTCSRPDCNPTTQVRDKATGTCVARPPIKVLNIHSDHLNTPRLLTDSQGEKVWEISPVTEPFGSSIPDEDPGNTGTKTTFNLRFPGQYFDKETNTHYNYYRDSYIPGLGRYGQSDPIGLNGGVNTYAYVNGNPIGLIDPWGLWGITFGGYLGAGGQITFGSDNGHGFMTGRVGFGLGAGIGYDPYGGIPGKPPSSKCDSGLVAHASWKLDFNAPFVGAGLEGGVARNYSQGESDFYKVKVLNLGDPVTGLALGGSIGAGFTYYSPVRK